MVRDAVMAGWKTRFRVLWWGLAFLVTSTGSMVAAGQQVEANSSSSVYMHDRARTWPETGMIGGRDAVSKRSEKKRMESLQADRRRLMVNEAEAIVVMSTGLAVGLGPTRAKVDGDALKRAESIEKLARNVRLRMLGATR